MESNYATVVTCDFLHSVVQCGEQSQPHYTYFVKIIPSDKKVDAKIFEWHNVHYIYLLFASFTEEKTAGKFSG